MQAKSILIALFFVAHGPTAAVEVRRSSSAGRHSVPVKRNVFHTRDGAGAKLHAENKFGKKTSPGFLAADSAHVQDTEDAAKVYRRFTGSQVTGPMAYGSEFLTEVSIGTPPQLLKINFDTGSADLWMFSTMIPRQDVDGQTSYDPNLSSSAKRMDGATWNVAYGDGSSSSGIVYTEVVSVGSLTVHGQVIEPAQVVSDSFTEDEHSDGLMGLSFSTLNTVSPTPQKTFFENAAPSLDAALFTVDLRAQTDGSFNFGFIDRKLYTGCIAYTPVDNSKGFWQVTGAGYSVGSGPPKMESFKAIADTGTTLMLLPDDMIKDYYSHVPGAEYSSQAAGYIFSCNTDLPDFVVRVTSHASITVPGAYINYAPVDSANSSCYGGAQSDKDIGFSILGDVFLKSAFVVFDLKNMRLGFASKNLGDVGSSSTKYTSNKVALASKVIMAAGGDEDAAPPQIANSTAAGNAASSRRGGARKGWRPDSEVHFGSR